MGTWTQQEPPTADFTDPAMGTSQQQRRQESETQTESAESSLGALWTCLCARSSTALWRGLFWKIRLWMLTDGVSVCLIECVCVRVAGVGMGGFTLPQWHISVRLSWTRTRRCYLSRFYCKADRSLSSWPLLPVFLCFNASSLCQWTHSSHYGCTCAFY